MKIFIRSFYIFSTKSVIAIILKITLWQLIKSYHSSNNCPKLFKLVLIYELPCLYYMIIKLKNLDENSRRYKMFKNLD